MQNPEKNQQNLGNPNQGQKQPIQNPQKEQQGGDKKFSHETDRKTDNSGGGQRAPGVDSNESTRRQ